METAKQSLEKLEAAFKAIQQVAADQSDIWWAQDAQEFRRIGTCVGMLRGRLMRHIEKSNKGQIL